MMKDKILSAHHNNLTSMQMGKISIFKNNESAFATYGFAISSFSNLEFGMLFLFLKLESGPAESIIESYWKIKSPRSRFERINSRINKLIEKDQIAEIWSSIAPRLDQAINVRNDLAHGEFAPIYVSQDRAIVGFWAQLAKSASKGSLSYNSQTTMIDGIKFYSPEELEQIGLEYIDLGEALAALAHQWNQPSSQS
mgnify:CR=1 FL=1